VGIATTTTLALFSASHPAVASHPRVKVLVLSGYAPERPVSHRLVPVRLGSYQVPPLCPYYI
jgi:hypothetical protein